MIDPRRVSLSREGVQANGQPPGYTKTAMPALTSPFAGASDGGDYQTSPLPHFQAGQMSALYGQWQYEVSQMDLPVEEDGMWLLRTWPTVTWMETIVDASGIQFDPSQTYWGPWTLAYPQLQPPPGYPILPSTRFLDDWHLTTSPTPPTKTWNARLTMTPGTAVVMQDVDAISPFPPWHLRKHDVHAVSIAENHALDWTTLIPVCDFYPFMGG